MAGEESIRKKDIYFRLWRAFRCSTNEDVTSYEVDELAFDVFQTYRGLALSERICGRRFGDLKDAGYITDVGTRESNHKTYRGGRGLVECYQLTEKGLDAVRKHEKWWLSMTAKEYKGKV